MVASGAFSVGNEFGIVVPTGTTSDIADLRLIQLHVLLKRLVPGILAAFTDGVFSPKRRGRRGARRTIAVVPQLGDRGEARLFGCPSFHPILKVVTIDVL